MYILGVFRRTALWGIFLVILGSIAWKSLEVLYLIVYFIGAYIFFVLLHLLICKIQKIRRSAGEAYFSALKHDLIAPFSKIGTFIAVVTKKWIIRDNSKFHNFIDGLQVATGGIWSIAILGLAVFFIVNIVL